MSVFKKDTSGPETTPATPAAHQETPEAFHNPFAGWMAPPAASHAPSMQHYVDDDLHAKPDAKPEVPTAASAAGNVYATILVSMRGATNDRTGHYQFINMLESISDPAVRHETMRQFEKQTGESLEGFIATASWSGDRDKNEALNLISPQRDEADAKLAAMPKEKRDALTKQAYAVAKTIDSTEGKDDAGDKDNARKMADALAGKTPEEIEAIRAVIQTTTHGHQGTYELLDRSLSGGKEDEAVAALSGDPVHTAIVGLFNAKGDPRRAQEILDRLDPSQIAQLKTNMPWMGAIVASMPEGERNEIEQRMKGNRAAADADRITSLLQDPKDSIVEDFSAKKSMDFSKNWEKHQHAEELAQQRMPENMLRELERMSPDQLNAARKAYDPAQHGGKTWDDMIASKFDKDDVQGQRVAALLRGDKVGDKALELREAMAKHDQQGIEHALANEDLASTDPERHKRGLEAQQELSARVQQMDAPTLPSWMVTAGVKQQTGRTIEQQLEDSSKDYLEGNVAPEEAYKAGQARMAAMMQRGKREDEINDNRITNQELLTGGKLSFATQMYRARKNDDERADLLDDLATNKELAEGKADYKAKYGKDMIATPDDSKYAYQATQRQWAELTRGKNRPLEEIEKEIAAEDRDVNETKIEQTRTEGVKAQRTGDQLRWDAHEIYDKQHSDKLEKVEKQREFWGGGIGSQHMVRENMEAMDAQAEPRNWWEVGSAKPASKESEETTHQIAEVERADQKTAREEKVKLAESQAKIFTTVMKLGSFMVGGPVATALFNGLVGIAGAQMKKSIGGEAINMTKEYEDVAIDTGGELLTAGLNGEISEAREAREAATALKEGKTLEAVGIEEGRKEAAEKAAQKVVGNAAGKMITTEAHDKIVEGKTDHDTTVDIVGSGLGQILPGLFGGKVEHALGHAKLDESVAKGIGTVTEKVTDKSVEGVTEAGNTDEEAKKEREKRKAEDEELAKAKEEREAEREHER